MNVSRDASDRGGALATFRSSVRNRGVSPFAPASPSLASGILLSPYSSCLHAGPPERPIPRRPLPIPSGIAARQPDATGPPCRPVPPLRYLRGRCRQACHVHRRLRSLVLMRKRWQSGVSERAAELESLQMALHRAYDARDGSAAATKKWHDAAVAFRSAVETFYAPYEEVLAGVRAGSSDGIEEATRFLVADPWCFRSGYLKAELMHALANADLPDHVVPPLREVVLHRITNRQPRLLRYAAQLAANLWDPDFEGKIAHLEREGSVAEQRAAAQVRAGACQRLRSLDGQLGPVAS